MLEMSFSILGPLGLCSRVWLTILFFQTPGDTCFLAILPSFGKFKQVEILDGDTQFQSDSSRFLVSQKASVIGYLSCKYWKTFLRFPLIVSIKKLQKDRFFNFNLQNYIFHNKVFEHLQPNLETLGKFPSHVCLLPVLAK